MKKQLNYTAFTIIKYIIGSNPYEKNLLNHTAFTIIKYIMKLGFMCVSIRLRLRDEGIIRPHKKLYSINQSYIFTFLHKSSDWNGHQNYQSFKYDALNNNSGPIGNYQTKAQKKEEI